MYKIKLKILTLQKISFIVQNFFTHLQDFLKCVTLKKRKKEENTMDRRYSIGGGGKPFYNKSFDDFSCRNFINFCRTNFKKTLAFTLAETFIVMGIIGVFAA